MTNLIDLITKVQISQHLCIVRIIKLKNIIFFLFCAHTLFYTSDNYYSMQFKMSTEYIKIAINAIVTRNIIKNIYKTREATESTFLLLIDVF